MTQRLYLTLVLEEFSQLLLTTPPRHVRDDFGVNPWRFKGLELVPTGLFREELQQVRAEFGGDS